tara:strand:+ start:18361 stop:19878 length:1518 start_codon:yes stop_codon:yes gene_type:complete
MKLNQNLWEKVKIDGYFWFGSNFFYGKDGEKIFLKLINKQNISVFEIPFLMRELNGSWSIVIKSKLTTISAVDRVCSRKIFYLKNKNNVVADCISKLIKKNQSNEIDQSLKSFYIKNKCCPPGLTLYKNLFSIPPGFCLINESGFLKKIQYSIFPSRKKYVSSNDIVQAEYNLLSVLEKLKKTIRLINPKNIFIPLSGGMDSRLIAFSIAQDKELRKKAICFAYGKSKKNLDCSISKLVAKELGIKWTFIQYTEKAWLNLFTEKEKIFEKLNVALSSPNLDSKIAIAKMIEKYGNGIFIPGYCLDVPAGSKLYENTRYQKEMLDSQKIDKIFTLDDEALNFEYTNLLIRLSGIVLSANENFKYKNSEFLLPFWSNEIYDFWFSLSYNSRKNKKLFKNIIKKIYSRSKYSLNSIPYANQTKKKLSFYLILLNKIKNFLHEIYSIPKIKGILRKLLSSKIIISNKKSDDLGIYNFCKNQEFKDKLEVEHPHSRVAEISYNFLINKND